jgi:hypothetical protein
MSNIDNYLNNSEMCSSSRVRVREEKNREEKNHHQKKMKNNHFDEFLRALRPKQFGMSAKHIGTSPQLSNRLLRA